MKIDQWRLLYYIRPSGVRDISNYTLVRYPRIADIGRKKEKSSAMEFALARVVHVLAVVLWIGGVAMVTTVLLPSLRRLDEQRGVALFEQLESRFACQARVTTVLTGLSGFYMLHVLDGWHRYTQVSFWWVHAMTLIWVLFSLVLFVFEPLFLNRWFHERGREQPAKTLALAHRFHLVLLLLSLLAVAGAVAGSHGWFWI